MMTPEDKFNILIKRAESPIEAMFLKAAKQKSNIYPSVGQTLADFN
jgi:hypothetical protein